MSAGSYGSRVSVYTDDFRAEGLLNVGARAGGHKCRVSDTLNDGTGFVVLTEVTIYERSCGEGAKEPSHHDIIILRKGEIKFVLPFD